MPNTNRSIHINLKPQDQVNELEQLNFQRHEHFSARLMVLLSENLILYNSSEPKQIVCQTSPQELMNQKPVSS
jgi:hypothetical protein